MANEPSLDISQPLLWGYFFTDASKSKLQQVTPLLEEQGYRIVDIYLADKEALSESDLWWLHIEKIELHTSDTLHKLNQKFYQFADDHQIESYDGMDVGPVHTPESIATSSSHSIGDRFSYMLKSFLQKFTN